MADLEPRSRTTKKVKCLIFIFVAIQIKLALSVWVCWTVFKCNVIQNMFAWWNKLVLIQTSNIKKSVIALSASNYSTDSKTYLSALYRTAGKSHRLPSHCHYSCSPGRSAVRLCSGPLKNSTSQSDWRLESLKQLKARTFAWGNNHSHSLTSSGYLQARLQTLCPYKQSNLLWFRQLGWRCLLLPLF